jgi:hypothetical protein
MYFQSPRFTIKQAPQQRNVYIEDPWRISLTNRSGISCYSFWRMFECSRHHGSRNDITLSNAKVPQTAWGLNHVQTFPSKIPWCSNHRPSTWPSNWSGPSTPSMFKKTLIKSPVFDSCINPYDLIPLFHRKNKCKNHWIFIFSPTEIDRYDISYDIP